MGRRTYEQITTELSPGMWPYSGAVTYVQTHDAPMVDTEDIRFTDDEPRRLINNLEEGTGKNIWIPVVLGGGIRLFEEIGRMINLTLVDTLNYNGVVEVVYDRRKVMK